MNNEIGRKLTSLTLLSILLASGITFAVPGTLPAAEASHNANLFVSAENSQFNNYFAGPQVIEVVVNDNDIRTLDDTHGEPDVTVNGKKLRMLQATDGNWYGYFASRLQAQSADATQPAGSGEGLDFGNFCDKTSGGAALGFSVSETVGVALASADAGVDGTTDITTAACTAAGAASLIHVIRENKTLSSGVAAIGQLGISDVNLWPFVQLYDFTVGGNVIIKYNKGGGTQTTTLTFDTIPSNLIKTSLDRSTYPQGAEVHVTMTDPQLNIDPTDEDSWTWGTDAGNSTVFYQAFDENGLDDALPTAGLQDLKGNLTTFMFEKNGKLTVNLAAQGAAVAEFDDNDDSNVNATVTALIEAPMTFVELEPKSGVFGNYDESDDANLDITDGAPRGKSATIRYNDKSTSIVVGFGFATVDIAVADGNWGSGEEVPVTIVDTDANKNSRSDEDLDLNNPDVVLIPTLKIGAPFTLEDGNEAVFIDGPVITVDTTAGFRAFDSLVGLVNDTTTMTVEKFSQRAIITPIENFSAPGSPGTIAINDAAGAGSGGLIIDLDRTGEDINAAINTGDDFVGFNMFNYDLRSLGENATTPITSVQIFLVNSSDTADFINGTGFLVGNYTALSIANVTSLQGLVNLNENSTEVDGFASFLANVTAIDDDDQVGLFFELSSVDGATFGLDNTSPDGTTSRSMPIVADFFSFGIVGDGTKTVDRINNAIYRFELEETGDNTSTFIGSVEYTMLNQINFADSATYNGLRTIDDEVTIIAHEDLTDEDAVRVNYNDLGADGVTTQVSDQQAALTHSGVVSFDKDTYKVADTVTVTLEDNDLNVDSDLIDIYVVVNPADTFGVTGVTDPADDTVGVAGLGTYTDGTAVGRLMDITFDDERWLDSLVDTDASAATNSCGDIDAAPLEARDNGLADSGFTLIETGVDTGVFKGDFQIPDVYCARTISGTAAERTISTTGQDLEVNYVDFRDASGELIEVGDGAGVRANTGSISLDRTVYPVPFGSLADFGGTTSESSPNGKSVFPVHLTGITGDVDTAAETIGDGALSIHVRVNDPDFDTSASGEDKIAIDRPDVAVGPVKITVSRGADEVVLAFAGGPAAQVGLIDADGTDSPLTTRELGPITEIAPNAGIFELDMEILYTDGPSSTKCPDTTAYHPTDGTKSTARTSRFDTPAAVAGDYCIIQGDIITVEYTDPTDSSGDSNTVTDSATFDLRNGVLQSDKSVYIIGADMILTLIEPDLDLDSDAAESVSLDLVEWDSDADTVTIGPNGGEAGTFDPEPSEFRETGDSTGIFQAVIEIPRILGGEQLDRGEEIQLEYTDWGPSGADFVGDEDEDINLTIFTSNFGATVELDQKVYTWTDKVFMTIVAPDHNFDSNLVDEIGDTNIDKIQVATRGEKLSPYKLVETGTDTGIFTGEVILTGFATHDADGDGDEGDATAAKSGKGPTDGFLPADDDDGLTVSFEFTEDETVVGSALIRWNIGEVQFLEASYPATGQGVVRVVDPDLNLNPESVDNFDVDVWSDSDAGGIDLTVTETNEATGIFEGTVFFTVTDESSGHRLRVAEGDTVTAEYEDNTLPSPYTTADELEITATTFIGSIVPPLERAPASNPRVVDAFGNELDEVNVDQQVQITADLANGQDRDQPFAYLVQIQDENGVTVSLSWITGSLAPGQSLNPAQSWTPTSSGTYNVQIFVWESVDNPDALSPPVSTEITVV